MIYSVFTKKGRWLLKIYVNVKKAGKKKNSITKIPYEFETPPQNVREFIGQIVSQCVRDYNRRMESTELLKNLSSGDMEEQAASGKISFGVNYGERQAVEEEAVKNAIQCFEDGIYRIFYGTEELTKTDESLQVAEESEFTFVRLTMLAGRMW